MSLIKPLKKKMQKRSTKLGKHKNQTMRLEALEPRLLLTGYDAVIQDATPFFNDVGQITEQWSALTQAPYVNTRTFDGSFYTENNINHMIRVDMTNARGGAGAANGWDLMRIASDLLVSADREQRFTIRLTGTQTDNTALGFNPDTSYRWKIIETTGDITGFDSSKFNIDTVDFKGGTDPAARIRDNFGNPTSLLSGKFTLEQEGKSIFLNYISGVKETSTLNDALSPENELLWEINDFSNNNKIVDTFNYKGAPATNLTGERERFGWDIFAVQGNLDCAARPMTIRTRSLSNSQNAITVAGAGLFGPVQNFDYSTDQQWTIIEATGTINNFNATHITGRRCFIALIISSSYFRPCHENHVSLFQEPFTILWHGGLKGQTFSTTMKTANSFYYCWNGD